MFELLKGIRVLDLSTVVLGPFASQLLADLGADVIKVEAPEGDIFRAAAPARHTGMGAGFLNLNRNKRSLVIDLKTTEGQATLHKLIKGSDVLLHNVRPAAAQKLGIDDTTVRSLNPRLVYCAAVGFGGDGPYADDPAYDDIMQAISGLASLNHTPDSPPAFAPTVLADKVAGLYATIGIAAALLHRERTGQGGSVEAPMFESLVSFLLAEHLSGHVFQPPLGSLRYDRLMTPYRRPYRTADGYLAVLPYTSRHWQRFLGLVGRHDLANADWVLDPSRRSERIGELYQVAAECMPAQTTAYWLAALKEQDIPCGPVNTLEDLLDDPHLQAVDFFQEIDHPSEGKLLGTRHPLRFIGAVTHPDRPAPRLGEDSQSVLADAGFSDAEIRALRARAVVSMPAANDPG
ncbi:CoA-transferase [Alcanivorax balearicus MACL04]|uniref:CoA-transferase n=1 Tax=Alloalcanivorax balearicus MACL04 TaxID=1177182 RepID=A0ABT2R042_9GAMM|nr:CoA transferase [Alloalcanivorax balearicus]MCU5783137.1 CoA-transferase [Alloalcanivorax balearicus MACL04]